MNAGAYRSAANLDRERHEDFEAGTVLEIDAATRAPAGNQISRRRRDRFGNEERQEFVVGEVDYQLEGFEPSGDVEVLVRASSPYDQRVGLQTRSILVAEQQQERLRRILLETQLQQPLFRVGRCAGFHAAFRREPRLWSQRDDHAAGNFHRPLEDQIPARIERPSAISSPGRIRHHAKTDVVQVAGTRRVDRGDLQAHLERYGITRRASPQWQACGHRTVGPVQVRGQECAQVAVGYRLGERRTCPARRRPWRADGGTARDRIPVYPTRRWTRPNHAGCRRIPSVGHSMWTRV